MDGLSGAAANGPIGAIPADAACCSLFEAAEKALRALLHQPYRPGLATGYPAAEEDQFRGELAGHNLVIETLPLVVGSVDGAFDLQRILRLTDFEAASGHPQPQFAAAGRGACEAGEVCADLHPVQHALRTRAFGALGGVLPGRREGLGLLVAACPAAAMIVSCGSSAGCVCAGWTAGGGAAAE